MERLRISKYIEVVPRTNDVAVYHKILGNLGLLDAPGIDVLQSFVRPHAPSAMKHLSDSHMKYIDELRERFFLVPETFDERAIVQEAIKYRVEQLESGYLVRGLQLILTNDCNLGCTYCFEKPASSVKKSSRIIPIKSVQADGPAEGCGSGYSSRELRKMTPDIAVAAVRNAMEVLRRNANRVLNVEFFGGEPLMNWPAIVAVLDAFGNGDPDDVQLTYSITTNGSLITTEIAKKLRDNGVTVMVSFDSPNNVNRLTKKGTNADHLIVRGIDILRREGAAITFNSVVSVSNIDDFDHDGLLDAAAAYGVQTVALILDLAVKPYEDSRSVEKVRTAVLKCRKKAIELKIPLTGYWHQIFEQMTGARPLNLEKGYKTCAAEGCKISVEPDGSISNCKCGGVPIGNIFRLDDVFKTQAYKTYALKAYETSPQCMGCEIEGFCSGLCMGTLENTYGDVSVRVEPTCALYKGLTSSLIKTTPGEMLESVYLNHYLQ